MKFNSLRSRVKPSQSEERGENQEYTDEEVSSGSWRRKSMLAAALLGIVLYFRRNQSSDGESKAAGGGRQSTSGGLGRRLKMIVLSTLVFAIARRVVRRFRSAR